jgi:hypothetical protein
MLPAFNMAGGIGVRPPKELALNKTVGIVLCIIGVIGLAWGGVNYRTQDAVVDIGPIHATHEETHHIPFPPVAGGLALLGGIVLLVASKK